MSLLCAEQLSDPRLKDITTLRLQYLHICEYYEHDDGNSNEDDSDRDDSDDEISDSDSNEGEGKSISDASSLGSGCGTSPPPGQPTLSLSPFLQLRRLELHPVAGPPNFITSLASGGTLSTFSLEMELHLSHEAWACQWANIENALQRNAATLQSLVLDCNTQIRPPDF